MSFVLYPGYRNVFSCMQCEKSDFFSDENICTECGSHACRHLTAPSGEGVTCFCCLGYPGSESDWPDWCFTMLPCEQFRGTNGE